MNGNNAFWFILFIIVSIWFWHDHKKLTTFVEAQSGYIDILHERVDQYADALYEANSNIQEARIYRWSSYEDMGYALDNLETVEP